MIGDALPIEHPPTSLSIISTGSSSNYTCLGVDKQGRRWEDDTFCTIPSSSSTFATNPVLFVYLMNLYGPTANMPIFLLRFFMHYNHIPFLISVSRIHYSMAPALFITADHPQIIAVLLRDYVAAHHVPKPLLLTNYTICTIHKLLIRPCPQIGWHR